MRLLLANDDGVHASGIRILRQQLLNDHDVTVIAPLEERSTTGHSLSLDKPLRLEEFGEKIFGCSGFPGDCILMGLGHVLKNSRPEVVVSGINKGANLGQDLYYSGTIAAAREAAFHQVPSIAVSLVLRKVTGEHHFFSAAQVTEILLKEKIHSLIPRLHLFNINVPDIPFEKIKGIKLTTPGFRHYSEDIHERTDARGRNYYWVVGHYSGFDQIEDSDCVATADDFVSLTPHRLVYHDHSDWTKLKEKLDEISHRYFSS